MRRKRHGFAVRQYGVPPTGYPTDETKFGRREFLTRAAGLLAFGAGAHGIRVHGAEATNRLYASRGMREEATREIPLANLQEPLRSRIHQVITRPTIYRRMPIEVVPCDPDLYVFLVRYPEVVVNMWQLMGITRVTIQRKAPYVYDAQDGAGTVSQVELVYGTRAKHLFLADGYYEGPLLPRRVTGRCVLLLRSDYRCDEGQHDHVTNQLDVFLQLDNTGAEIVARTLQPLLGRTADSNFVEAVRFVSQVSHVAETNGPGVERLVTRLTNVEPSVRDRFSQLAITLHQRAVMRAIANSPEEPAARLGDLIPQEMIK